MNTGLTENKNYSDYGKMMNTTTLLEVLIGISKTSAWAQGLLITYETKAGWQSSVKLWLFPSLYQRGVNDPKVEPSFYRNDFAILFKVENDVSFKKWKEITFTYTDDRINRSRIVNLDCDEYYEPHVSHYSGHTYTSWMEFVDPAYRIHAEILEEIEKEKKDRTVWRTFKRKMYDWANTLGIAGGFGL